MYSQGSPIIIAAVGLLKENATGRIIAQAKFLNINNEPIKALVVNVKAYDVMGNQLAGVENFQYLDLNIKRDQFFGSDVPIVLPDPSTRIISVEPISVLSGFNTIQKLSQDKWETLPESVLLEKKYRDNNLIKQFAIDYCREATYESYSAEDLWFCFCGHFNHKEETHCHVCKAAQNEVCGYDIAALKERAKVRFDTEQKRIQEEYERREQAQREKEAREEAERAAIAEQLALKRSRKKKVLKRIGIGILMALILAGAIFAYPKVAEYAAPKFKEYQYNKAISLIEKEDYEKGYDILQNGEFDDAEDLINESKYQRSLSLIDEKRYEEAYPLLEEIKGYRDSAQRLNSAKGAHATELFKAGDVEGAKKILSLAGNLTATGLTDELNYLRAQILKEEGKYEEVYKLLKPLAEKDYKDSQLLCNEAHYQWATELLKSENFSDAEEQFALLTTYKDSAEKFEFAKNEKTYQEAKQCMSQKSYYGAAKLFDELGTYKDSAELMKESYYNYAIIYKNSKAYGYAIKYFELADGYKDAADHLAELKQLQADAARQAAQQAAQQKAKQEADLKAACKAGKSLKFAIRDEFKKTGYAVHSIIAKLSEDEKTYTISINVTLPAKCNMSFFSPPNGDIFMKRRDDGSLGTHTYSFTVSRSKLKSVKNEVTHNFYVPGSIDRNRGYAFWQVNQLY